MATIFLLDFPKEGDKRQLTYTSSVIQRWGERQGSAAFVSVDNRFIMTDYAFEHKEVGLLRHLLNCQGIRYRAIANIDLEQLGKVLFTKAINNKTKKEH